MNVEMQKRLMQGRFGLEKEGLRVNKYTLLPSVSDHPFGPDPNISRDFCEAQTEIITPVCPDTDRLFEALHDLNERVNAVLAQRDEILWNYSNPPAGYDVRKIRIAHFEGPEKEKEEYRKYLKKNTAFPECFLAASISIFPSPNRRWRPLPELTISPTASITGLIAAKPGIFPAACPKLSPTAST